MHRRTLLRVAAGAVGGGAATAAGLSVATGGAAETALTLAVDGDSAEIGTDGTVTAVRLDLDVEWAYDLPSETAPATVVIEVAAGTDGDVTVVASAESAQLFVEADGTESFDVGLIEQSALSSSDVEPSGTGERETAVTIEARLRVETTGGDASAFGEVGGGGSLTISTE